MTKNPVHLVEESSSPSALVVGDNKIIPFLSSVLKEKGCRVKVVESYAFLEGRFDYIFQFGYFKYVDLAVKKFLAPSGKLLFIEEAEENLVEIKRVKVVRAGDLSLWDPQELSQKILKAIFTSSSNIADIRKEHYAPKIRSFPSQQKTTLPLTLPPPLVVKKKINLKRILAFIICIFILFFLVLTGVSYSYSLKIKNTLTNFKSDFETANWQVFMKDLQEAKKELTTVNKTYQVVSSVLFPFKNTPLFLQTEKVLSSFDKIFQSSDDIFSYTNNLLSQYKDLVSHGGEISQKDLEELSKRLNFFIDSISSAKNEVNEIDLSFFPKENTVYFLDKTFEKAVSIRDLIPISEKLFFADTPSVYLVLLQNNMELRPTGGFIGSFGLLSIKKGKILDFRIEDVYTADGQLKGHVDPPDPIRKYLSQPHFFLRDSNFDPDFAASSGWAVWFLQKELGNKVDGVIGINLFFIERLLKATGPFKIADFGNEEINADNFFFKANLYSQKDFFPGSTQKKDFLTAVANTLMARFTSKDSSIKIEAIPVVKESLERKEILLFSFDSSVQKLIEEKGYGGRIVNVGCVAGSLITSSCLSDYLSVVEANLGVNKANYFVSKSVTLEKKIASNGQVENIVTLAYENSPASSVLASSYTNYLRLFVPRGSKLLNITLNNTFLPLTNIDIENYGTDKTSYGTLFKIARGEKGVVKIDYLLPHLLNSGISSYQFFYQKQGGDKTSPLVLSFIYPENLKLTPVNFKSATERKQEIFYTTDTSVDRVFAFSVR